MATENNGHILTVLDIASLADSSGKYRAQWHKIPAHWKAESVDNFAKTHCPTRNLTVVAVSAERHVEIMAGDFYGYATEKNNPDSVVSVPYWHGKV